MDRLVVTASFLAALVVTTALILAVVTVTGHPGPGRLIMRPAATSSAGR